MKLKFDNEEVIDFNQIWNTLISKRKFQLESFATYIDRVIKGEINDIKRLKNKRYKYERY